MIRCFICGKLTNEKVNVSCHKSQVFPMLHNINYYWLRKVTTGEEGKTGERKNAVNSGHNIFPIALYPDQKKSNTIVYKKGPKDKLWFVNYIIWNVVNISLWWKERLK